MIDSPSERKHPMGEGRVGWKHSDWMRRERGWVLAGDWQRLTFQGKGYPAVTVAEAP